MLLKHSILTSLVKQMLHGWVMGERGECASFCNIVLFVPGMFSQSAPTPKPAAPKPAAAPRREVSSQESTAPKKAQQIASAVGKV